MTRRKTILGMTTTSIAPLLIVAWFLLSNHCALRVIASPGDATPETTGCPMHSAPAKKKPAAKTPCCKDLRAIVAKLVSAKLIAPGLTGLRDYGTKISVLPPKDARELKGLDTGPPGCFSFAESVLQESMLSHAPPVS
jgi:hypothetical protein